MSTPTHEIKATITGKVQMVMFRDFIKRNAQALGLLGIVQNIKDGSVEVIAQGEKNSLEKLIESLHKGPLLAHIIRVDVQWREPQNDFSGFTIQYKK
jgi:acylphosphatase